MEQQNKYRVIVSARVAQMLVSHAAFLAQISPVAAERLTVEFEKAARSLEQMPQRCPWLKGEYIPKNAYRFILFEKRYMLISQIADDVVYADYVVDCRQDYGGCSDKLKQKTGDFLHCGKSPVFVILLPVSAAPDHPNPGEKEPCQNSRSLRPDWADEAAAFSCSHIAGVPTSASFPDT